MIIIPAIDLIDGKCVRLTQGDFTKKKEYSNNPLEIAQYFKEIGASRIHIVDLDGAKTGNSKNREVIKDIKKKTGLIIETGGGIRSEDDIQELIKANIDYLILGTILVENPELVKSWIYKYNKNLIAGIDAKNNMVKVKGWKEGKGINALDFGKKIKGTGFTTAVFTDISRDGKLQGANITQTINFAKITGLDVILSGGISGETDLKKIKKFNEKKIIGVIIGKAFYEGRIDLKQAIGKYQ